MVANEWKDENDKVMPVKQWLEDRRLMQVILSKQNYWKFYSYLSKQMSVNADKFSFHFKCNLKSMHISWMQDQKYKDYEPENW